MRSLRSLRRWLYLGHRWLGITTCGLFVLWFISGVIMMYVQFPALNDTERTRYSQRISPDSVVLTPDQAIQTLALVEFPQSLRLQAWGKETFYYIKDWHGKAYSVSAMDGRLLRTLATSDVATMSSVWAPHPTPPEKIDIDQWTVSQRYDALRPFYRIDLNDEVATQVYVSTRTGEVVLDTTRTERIWCWLGHVVHWMYFTDLRAASDVWRDVVLWVSGVGIAVAISGFWIGLLRVRFKKRYRHGAITPYRHWHRLHHIVGLAAGFFVITWIVSGWLSMSPNQWLTGEGIGPLARQAYAGHTQPTIGVTRSSLQTLLESDNIHELRFDWIAGTPTLQVVNENGGNNIRHATEGTTLMWNALHMQHAAKTLLPQANVIRVTQLDHYDWYWYAHHQTRTLPVLRVEFDDSESTWVHIDLNTGAILNSMGSDERAHRWWFNAMHSLDLLPLIQYRPAWDMVVWGLSLSGLSLSLSACVIGWRRLRG